MGRSAKERCGVSCVFAKQVKSPINGDLANFSKSKYGIRISGRVASRNLDSRPNDRGATCRPEYFNRRISR